MDNIIKSINPDKIYGEHLGLLETIKCLESPYYFATIYLKINGKNYITKYSEEDFNNIIKNYNKCLNLNQI